MIGCSGNWRVNSTEHPGMLGAGQRACSYCGSMHPDDLFQAIADGAEVEPTDKNYKAYVRFADGRHHKFYFEHLDEAQRQRFVDLLNAKAVKIGYPGHFYVRPFFVGAGG